MTTPEPMSAPQTGQEVAAAGFYYARTPTLIIDARGVVADFNVACRELLGVDAAGCKGQHFSYLVGRLRGKNNGPMVPDDGPAMLYLLAPDPAQDQAVVLTAADLRVATTDFLYRSDHLGPLSLHVSEVPCIDTASGGYAGSLVSLEVDGAADPEAFPRALDGRLRREVMWQVYAASYDRVLPEVDFYQEVLERHVTALRPDAIRTILDIGAGTGNVAVELLRLGKQVTAVDTSRAMLARLYAKATGYDDRLTVVEDTAEHLPQLRDESFDGVNVLLALFDMQDAGSALREALRLLRRGGKLVLTEPRTCFDARQLFVAAEESLRKKGLFARLAPDWARIESVGPIISDTIRQERWHAEIIFEYLRQLGFRDLTFQQSHMGNCATIEGTRPSG